MNWVLASLLANVSIMWIEYLNRTGDYPTFLAAIRHTGPLILVGQLGLFYTFRGAPTFLTAWAIFTTGNAVLRLLSSYVLVAEPPGLWTLLGYGLMFLGSWTIVSVKGG